MALARGWVESPVTVLTPAGPISIRCDGAFFLTGPAILVAEGVFWM
jgi:diaminopimelate epimerase